MELPGGNRREPLRSYSLLPFTGALPWVPIQHCCRVLIVQAGGAARRRRAPAVRSRVSGRRASVGCSDGRSGRATVWPTSRRSFPGSRNRSFASPQPPGGTGHFQRATGSIEHYRRSQDELTLTKPYFSKIAFECVVRICASDPDGTIQCIYARPF